MPISSPKSSMVEELDKTRGMSAYDSEKKDDRSYDSQYLAWTH